MVPKDVPASDAKLWRYMDFTKFVAMLNNKALYFCRLDHLGDPFEGAKGSKVLEEKCDQFYLDFLRHAYRTAPGQNPANLTDENVEEIANKALKSLRDAGDWDRKISFVNCWHEAPHESEAMWRLYAGWKLSLDGSPGGVVVQTTAQRLTAEFNQSKRVHVGRVQYIDYSSRMVGINEANWHKAKSLEHEKEVRAIMVRHDAGDVRGLNMPVDLTAIVEQVRVAPLSPVWFSDLVSSVAKAYDFHFPVERSALEAQPFY